VTSALVFGAIISLAKRFGSRDLAQGLLDHSAAQLAQVIAERIVQLGAAFEFAPAPCAPAFADANILNRRPC
jgi:hypothetical protein